MASINELLGTPELAPALRLPDVLRTLPPDTVRRTLWLPLSRAERAALRLTCRDLRSLACAAWMRDLHLQLPLRVPMPPGAAPKPPPAPLTSAGCCDPTSTPEAAAAAQFHQQQPSTAHGSPRAATTTWAPPIPPGPPAVPATAAPHRPRQQRQRLLHDTFSAPRCVIFHLQQQAGASAGLSAPPAGLAQRFSPQQDELDSALLQHFSAIRRPAAATEPVVPAAAAGAGPDVASAFAAAGGRWDARDARGTPGRLGGAGPGDGGGDTSSTGRQDTAAGPAGRPGGPPTLQQLLLDDSRRRGGEGRAVGGDYYYDGCGSRGNGSFSDSIAPESCREVAGWGLGVCAGVRTVQLLGLPYSWILYAPYMARLAAAYPSLDRLVVRCTAMAATTTTSFSPAGWRPHAAPDGQTPAGVAAAADVGKLGMGPSSWASGQGGFGGGAGSGGGLPSLPWSDAIWRTPGAAGGVSGRARGGAASRGAEDAGDAASSDNRSGEANVLVCPSAGPLAAFNRLRALVLSCPEPDVIPIMMSTLPDALAPPTGGFPPALPGLRSLRLSGVAATEPLLDAVARLTGLTELGLLLRLRVLVPGAESATQTALPVAPLPEGPTVAPLPEGPSGSNGSQQPVCAPARLPGQLTALTQLRALAVDLYGRTGRWLDGAAAAAAEVARAVAAAGAAAAGDAGGDDDGGGGGGGTEGGPRTPRPVGPGTWARLVGCCCRTLTSLELPQVALGPPLLLALCGCPGLTRLEALGLDTSRSGATKASDPRSLSAPGTHLHPHPQLQRLEVLRLEDVRLGRGLLDFLDMAPRLRRLALGLRVEAFQVPTHLRAPGPTRRVGRRGGVGDGASANDSGGGRSQEGMGLGAGGEDDGVEERRRPGASSADDNGSIGTSHLPQPLRPTGSGEALMSSSNQDSGKEPRDSREQLQLHHNHEEREEENEQEGWHRAFEAAAAAGEEVAREAAAGTAAATAAALAAAAASAMGVGGAGAAGPTTTTTMARRNRSPGGGLGSGGGGGGGAWVAFLRRCWRCEGAGVELALAGALDWPAVVGWLAGALGARLRGLGLQASGQRCQVRDEALAAIVYGLPYLRSLDLLSYDVSPQGLLQLAALQDLTELRFDMQDFTAWMPPEYLLRLALAAQAERQRRRSEPRHVTVAGRRYRASLWSADQAGTAGPPPSESAVAAEPSGRRTDGFGSRADASSSGGGRRLTIVATFLSEAQAAAINDQLSVVEDTRGVGFGGGGDSSRSGVLLAPGCVRVVAADAADDWQDDGDEECWAARS